MYDTRASPAGLVGAAGSCVDEGSELNRAVRSVTVASRPLEVLRTSQNHPGARNAAWVRFINPAWPASSGHPKWGEPRPERTHDPWNRSGYRSRYPYIPTFRGRPGLVLALELPKQPSLRSSSRRAGHNQNFLPHEPSPFESAPAARLESAVHG